MQKFSFKNHILPHLVAIVVFLGITVAFYSPVFFDGKEIFQNDVVQGISGGNEISEFRKQTGEEPLWTNSMFGVCLLI